MQSFWVLILTVAFQGEPTLKVAITGFATSQACAAKGQEALRTPMTPQTPQEVGKHYSVKYECIRGVEE